MATVPQNEDELSDPNDPESHKQTLGEHLDELRARITRSLLVLAAAWLAGWFLEPAIYAHFNQILQDPDLWPKGQVGKEVFTNFAEPFFLKFKLSFILGLIFAGPIILWQLWGFVRPALKPTEAKPLRQVMPISAILFGLGVAMAYVLLKPAFAWFLSFLEDFSGASLMQNPGTYIVFIAKMLFAFGLGFQLPIVIWLLGSIGLVSSESLWKNWRVALAIITFVTAFLTPGGDLFSNVAMGVPLVILYFGSIFAVRFTEKKREKRRIQQERDYESGA
jgi:sec-independent protein translocase protein TatC